MRTQPKYETAYCTLKNTNRLDGDYTLSAKIALGTWDGVEDFEDESIFYYMDGEPLKVGSPICDGYIVTAINANEEK